MSSLAKLANGKEVSPKELHSHGLIERADGLVKVIGGGSLEGVLVLKVHRVSQGAKAAIERGGGSVELLPMPESGGQGKRKPAKA